MALSTFCGVSGAHHRLSAPNNFVTAAPSTKRILFWNLDFVFYLWYGKWYQENESWSLCRNGYIYGMILDEMMMMMI